MITTETYTYTETADGMEPTDIQRLFICAAVLGLELINGNQKDPKDPPLVVEHDLDGGSKIIEFNPFENSSQAFNLMVALRLYVDGISNQFWEVAGRRMETARHTDLKRAIVTCISEARITGTI